MFHAEDELGLNVLYAFADASFGVDKPRGVRVLFLNGGPISWRAKKQTIIQLSTAGAEVTESALCALDVVSIRKLLEEVGLWQEQATIIFSDNQAAITISHHEGSLERSRSRHLSLRILKIRELVKSEIIILKFTRTMRMVADIFTKQLPIPQWQLIQSWLQGLTPLPVDELLEDMKLMPDPDRDDN